MTATLLTRRNALITGGLSMMATMAFSDRMMTRAHAVNTGDVGVDPFTSFMKLYSTLEPGEHWWWFMGHWDLIVPGRLPVSVVGHDTLIRRRVTRNANGMYTSRGWEGMIFSDLKTREPVDRMVNPVTDRAVFPFHAKDGPLDTNISPAGIHLGVGSDSERTLSIDLPKTVAGEDIWLQRDYRYAGPSTLDPQKWPVETAGDKNWTNMETIYRGKVADVRRTDTAFVPTDYTISGQSVVVPWLAMGPDLAYMGWTGYGKKLQSPDEMPAKNLKWFEQRHPELFVSDVPWVDHTNAFYGYMADREPLKP